MYRTLFHVFNWLMLGSFMLAAYIDYDKDWRHYQAKYFELQAKDLEAQAAKAKTPQEAADLRARAAAARHEPSMIRQIIAKDLGRIDRCITCHVGMDEFANPTLTTNFKENPFKGHPDLGLYAKNHPFAKFGCTSCHSGQGIATSKIAAHGDAENWEQVMLRGPMMQANCAKCHGDIEHTKGAEFVAKGKALFDTHGCLGCHQLKGKGGGGPSSISVDLGDVADKPLERIALYNFSLIKDEHGKQYPREEWKLPLWIEAHLTNDPERFIPNDPLAKFNKEPIAPSGMQDYAKDFNREEARAVTAYLLSQTNESVPAKYYKFAPPRPEPKFASAAEHGKYVFHKYGCSGCHGMDAKAGRRNFNALGPGQPELKDVEKDGDKLVEAMMMGREPTLRDTVGTYTREELTKKIQNGVMASAINRYKADGAVPPLFMPAWKDKVKGQELEDLVTYLMSIAKKDESSF